MTITPVESPDDWVEITDSEHVLRVCDEETFHTNAGGWVSSVELESVGKKKSPSLRVRCRRKDLPPLPSPKRVPVRVWFDAHSVIASDDQPTNYHQELFIDANGFYVEVQS